MSTFDEPTLALIEEHVRRLLALMDFAAATVTCQLREGSASETLTLVVTIKAGEAGKWLIGPRGSHLAALQHLIRIVLARQLPSPITISVDVNQYRLQREQRLHHVAVDAASQAQRTGRTVVLPPMNAADRRILHTALAQQDRVRTESMGEEPNRRVVVRPVFL